MPADSTQVKRVITLNVLSQDLPLCFYLVLNSFTSRATPLLCLHSPLSVWFTAKLNQQWHFFSFIVVFFGWRWVQNIPAQSVSVSVGFSSIPFISVSISLALVFESVLMFLKRSLRTFSDSRRTVWEYRSNQNHIYLLSFKVYTLFFLVKTYCSTYITHKATWPPSVWSDILVCYANH